MAENYDRYPENAEGSYYVNEACITCGLCMRTAPDNFKFTVGDKHAIVYKQPENKSEEEACKEAVESCPAAAIRDDG